MEPVRYHIPVLLEESVSALCIKESGIYVDATMGGAGHTREILRRLGKKGRLIAFDRDSDAVVNAPDDPRLTVIHNNFRFIRNFLYVAGIKADGILADLGVSSHQFDTGERGFSFRFSSELDMRMNRKSSLKAADIINSYSFEDLARIFRDYGEIEKAGKIADMICREREKSPIISTDDLSKAINPALPKFSEHKFLARLYQALRIEVNGEMDALADFLEGASASLAEGGRLSIITYHSLEDRMVKNFIKSGNIDGKNITDIYGNVRNTLRSVNKKPILPEEREISSNTRARSAKLRVAEKIREDNHERKG